MANFCSKCGTPIPAGAAACTACGTAATPVVAVPVVPVVVQPAQGSSALKIVLIIIAIFVGLGILGAGAVGFIAWRAAHAIRMAANGEKMSMNLPGGSFSAGSNENFSASDLGTDIYPGATEGKGGMRMSLPAGTMVTAVYVTSDSKDQVAAFYKNKFGSANVTSMDSADGAVITYAKSQEESVAVTITANSSEYNGKTQIVIVHTTSTKSS